MQTLSSHAKMGLPDAPDPGCMPPLTRALFDKLSAAEASGRFKMIGGTALAMWFSHRKSEDIDFAIAAGKLPRAIVDGILAVLNNPLCITPLSARDDFLNDGLDVDDYHQDWLVDGVKLSFFTYGSSEYHRQVLMDGSGDSRIGHIVIPDVKTISRTKCHAIAHRIKSRDLYDALQIINHKVMSFGEVIAEMQRSQPHLTYEMAVYRVLDWKIPETDEGLLPVGVQVSIADIRQALANEKKLFEEDVAAELFAAVQLLPELK